MDDITLGLMEVTVTTVRSLPFLRCDLDQIGIIVSPPKAVALPPEKAHPDGG